MSIQWSLEKDFTLRIPTTKLILFFKTVNNYLILDILDTVSTNVTAMTEMEQDTGRRAILNSSVFHKLLILKNLLPTGQPNRDHSPLCT